MHHQKAMCIHNYLRMESFIVTHSSATGQYSMRKQYLCIHYKTIIIATLDTKLGTLGKIRPVSNTFSLHSIQTASELLQLHAYRTYFSLFQTSIFCSFLLISKVGLVKTNFLERNRTFILMCLLWNFFYLYCSPSFSKLSLWIMRNSWGECWAAIATKVTSLSTAILAIVPNGPPHFSLEWVDSREHT